MCSTLLVHVHVSHTNNGSALTDLVLNMKWYLAASASSLSYGGINTDTSLDVDHVCKSQNGVVIPQQA